MEYTQIEMRVCFDADSCPIDLSDEQAKKLASRTVEIGYLEDGYFIANSGNRYLEEHTLCLANAI